MTAQDRALVERILRRAERRDARWRAQVSESGDPQAEAGWREGYRWAFESIRRVMDKELPR